MLPPKRGRSPKWPQLTCEGTEVSRKQLEAERGGAGMHTGDLKGETKGEGRRGLKAWCWNWVTRNCTEGEGGNMPVRNEERQGREGGMTRGQLAFGQLHRKTLKTSDTSSKLGLFMGQGAFGRGQSFGREVVLLARSTG